MWHESKIGYHVWVISYCTFCRRYQQHAHIFRPQFHIRILRRRFKRDSAAPPRAVTHQHYTASGVNEAHWGPCGRSFETIRSHRVDQMQRSIPQCDQAITDDTRWECAKMRRDGSIKKWRLALIQARQGQGLYPRFDDISPDAYWIWVRDEIYTGRHRFLCAYNFTPPS